MQKRSEWFKKKYTIPEWRLSLFYFSGFNQSYSLKFNSKKALFQGTDRIFITEGTFNVVIPEKRKSKNKHLFLFNDLILVTKSQKLSSKLKFVSVFKLSAFTSVKETNDRTLEIINPTQAEKMILYSHDSRNITVWGGFLGSIIKSLAERERTENSHITQEALLNKTEDFLRNLRH